MDTEGNGAKVSEIVELGAIETIDLVPTGRMHCWRFRPDVPIDWRASRIHGIRNEHVMRMPRIGDLASEIVSVLHDHPIGGQAVHGDLDVLSRSLPGWRPRSAVDTFGMARSLLPGLRSYKLSRMTDELGLRERIDASAGGSAHSALNDAMACIVLIQEMRRLSDERSFSHAFMQAESLDRWDRMVANRIRKVERARNATARHEARIRMRQLVRSGESDREALREAATAIAAARPPGTKKRPPRGGPV